MWWQLNRARPVLGDVHRVLWGADPLRGGHLCWVPSGSKGERCSGSSQWLGKTAAPGRWEARWLYWGSSGCANLYQTRLSSSACLRVRTCWQAPFPAAWRPLPLMEALAELPVLGLLARQHMAWAGHAAHGCLVLAHSTAWEPEGIPFRPHTAQAIKGAAAPPSLLRTLQLGCLKGSYFLSGRWGGGVPVSGRSLFLPRMENETL